MQSGIFLCYRQGDTQDIANRLAGELAAQFGANRILRDTTAFKSGEHFTEAFDHTLSACEIMLVLIGPDWLTIKDQNNERYLDNYQDSIRAQIALGLQRKLRVVPVLVNAGVFPNELDLPPDIRALAHRQALTLSDSEWQRDVQRLVAALDRALVQPSAPNAPAAAAPPPAMAAPPPPIADSFPASAAPARYAPAAPTETTTGSPPVAQQQQQQQQGFDPHSSTLESPSVAPVVMPSPAARSSSTPKLSRPKFRTADRDDQVAYSQQPSTGAPSNEVYLGVATPPKCQRGELFVARFAAYTEPNREKVSALMQREAPTAQQRLDLEHCLWKVGSRVSIHLAAAHAKVANPVQSFIWDGQYKVLRFDVTVDVDCPSEQILLRFDIAVEGLSITSIRPEVEIATNSSSMSHHEGEKTTRIVAPRSAFASYTSKDRREVMARVRSVQIATKMDVFLDCLSLRPSDQWKPQLLKEIENRDVFWLFWSRDARASPWVEWEWREALKCKTIHNIQPHPLEPQDLAPPPKELAELQFGAMYEWYLVHLRGSLFQRIGLWFRRWITRPA